MDSKNLIIVGMVIIAVVAIGSCFVVFHKNTELTVMSSGNLNIGDEISVVLTSTEAPLANQDIYLTLIEPSTEEVSITAKTNSEGIATFTLNNVSEGDYHAKFDFKGNLQYGSSSAELNLSFNTLAKEVSSTSTDDGWPFDAPEGWHWKRTPPGETWLIKDDGSVERLYVGSELYLENTRVDGEMEKSYDNGKDAAGVQVSAPKRYF